MIDFVSIGNLPKGLKILLCEKKTEKYWLIYLYCLMSCNGLKKINSVLKIEKQICDVLLL